ncbi:MAG: hypothetical protein WA618_12920 [Terriglobales bacterium]
MDGDFIIQPESSDHLQLEDLLKDLLQVFTKHNCALIHKSELNMTLIVRPEALGKIRAVAQVREISGLRVEFKRFEGDKRKLVRQ